MNKEQALALCFKQFLEEVGFQALIKNPEGFAQLITDNGVLEHPVALRFAKEIQSATLKMEQELTQAVRRVCGEDNG